VKEEKRPCQDKKFQSVFLRIKIQIERGETHGCKVRYQEEGCQETCGQEEKACRQENPRQVISAAPDKWHGG